MFYFKKNKLKFHKKINTNKILLSANNKVSISLIVYVFLNNIENIGFNKKKFKKWFKSNRKEILSFYYEGDRSFLKTFFDDNILEKKLENLFCFNNEDNIYKLVNGNEYENDDPYNEFLKINNNFNNLIDYLKKIMNHNFNTFFVFLNSILFPYKKGFSWR